MRGCEGELFLESSLIKQAGSIAMVWARREDGRWLFDEEDNKI